MRGSVPRSLNTERVEIYDSKQPFTVTGEKLEGTPVEIREAGPELTELFRKVAAKTPRAPKRTRN